ncbi:zinc finger MYM-type protein 5-like [Solenopsis invicta]|uniref:zinc finger MYM-type protein 5-like n=1 Tax=Solenopsis invicta TaxID=13686 RepID=UPI00193DCCB2|nr:zinc finger MYM-type protein 5-like [Solenopsis invicta]
MSDGRIRLSGSQYKKRRLDKAERERSIVEKTLKIDSFFNQPKVVNQLNNFEKPAISIADSSKQLLPITGSDNIKEIVPTACDIDPNSNFTSKSPEPTTSSSITNINQSNNLAVNSNVIVKDPALWVINDATRKYVLQHGINQDHVHDKNFDFSRSKRLCGKQYRYLNESLFKTQLVNGQIVKRAYLMYSESSGSVFCVPCQLFGGTTKIAKEGFDDWKHGNDALKNYENSFEHKSCVLEMKMRSNTLGKIDTHFSCQIDTEKKYWRNVLKRVVATVRALVTTGLPLRGHIEKFGSSSSGNFIMYLELISEFDPFLAEHIARYGNPGQGHTSYLSSTTYEING